MGIAQQVVGYGDVQPGMPLAGIVKSTDSPAGLVVEIAPGVRALVPVIHMSDLGTEAARKKFKVGSCDGLLWLVAFPLAVARNSCGQPSCWLTPARCLSALLLGPVCCLTAGRAAAA